MTDNMDEKETLVIKDFKFFGGKHCQTAALKKVLAHRGLHFTEELLLGLGGGIGFIYWFSKKMPFPFIGSRNSKVDEFVLKICSRIGASAGIFGTSSGKRAHRELKEVLRRGAREPGGYNFFEFVIIYGQRPAGGGRRR